MIEGARGYLFMVVSALQMIRPIRTQRTIHLVLRTDRLDVGRQYISIQTDILMDAPIGGCRRYGVRSYSWLEIICHIASGEYADHADDREKPVRSFPELADLTL